MKCRARFDDEYVCGLELGESHGPEHASEDGRARWQGDGRSFTSNGYLYVVDREGVWRRA